MESAFEDSPSEAIAKPLAAERTERVQLRGEFDGDEPTFTELLGLVAGRPVRVEVDGSEVTFLGSGALRQLLLIHEQLTAAGGTLVIVSPSSIVSRVLDVTGLAEHFSE